MNEIKRPKTVAEMGQMVALVASECEGIFDGQTEILAYMLSCKMYEQVSGDSSLPIKSNIGRVMRQKGIDADNMQELVVAYCNEGEAAMDEMEELFESMDEDEQRKWIAPPSDKREAP